MGFDGARERLKVAANKRKERHDPRVTCRDFDDNQLVYLKEHGVGGRVKIQDVWSPVFYKILRAPRDGGSVYSIAPLGDPHTIKHVHRTMLKLVPPNLCPVFQPQLGPTETVPLRTVGEDEEVEEGLWMQVQMSRDNTTRVRAPRELLRNNPATSLPKSPVRLSPPVSIAEPPPSRA